MTFFAAAEPMPAFPWAPPRNKVPVAVDWHFLLVRTAYTAVAVTNFAASPEGVQFSLVTRARPVAGDAEGPYGDGFPSGLRFGIGLPDGSRIDRDERARDSQSIPVPPGFHLSGLGGGGGGWTSREDLWLWPLPGPGDLSFACAWPSRGATEAVAETSTDALLQAAGLATELWPELWPVPPSTT